MAPPSANVSASAPWSHALGRRSWREELTASDGSTIEVRSRMLAIKYSRRWYKKVGPVYRCPGQV